MIRPVDRSAGTTFRFETREMRLKFVALAAAASVSILANAHAQSSPNLTGLTEADIKPCEEFLSYRASLYSEPADASNLEIALQSPAFKIPYGLEDARYWLAFADRNVKALESRDETAMRETIGVAFSGKSYEDRLATDRRFRCLLQVRIGQLTGEKQVFMHLPAARPAPAATADLDPGLRSLGAGELFALADELDQAGKQDDARAARRALIARFPDSPLAVIAAQQLAAAAAKP